MSSSLVSEEMSDFDGTGLYSVGRRAGQRSAHIYCGSDVQSLCHNSRRQRFPLIAYIAGELTCQKCLATYRRLEKRS